MKNFLLSAIVSAMAVLPLYGADAPHTAHAHALPPGPPPPLPPPPNNTERLKHILLIRELLLAKYDINQDGKLDSTEKETLLRDADGERKRARQAFLKRYDRDGDGKLSHEERAAMSEEMKKRGKPFIRRKPISPPPADGSKTAGAGMVMENRKHERFSIRPSVFMLAQSILLKKYDENHNGIIDPAEFEKILTEATRLYTDKTQKLLVKYDKNGDGILSPEEKTAIPRKPTPEEAAEQNEALDDIDLFIQESFDTELMESIEDVEADSDES